MARLKKPTAKRGRPPKDANAPKRKYTRRKVRDTAEPRMDFGVSAAQELASARYQALHMVLETRKLTSGYGVTPESLIADAEKIRKYLSGGVVSEAETGSAASPNDDTDVVVGSGADTVFDTAGQTIPAASTYNLRDAAE